jgi:hypothetical protein
MGPQRGQRGQQSRKVTSKAAGKIATKSVEKNSNRSSTDQMAHTEEIRVILRVIPGIGVPSGIDWDGTGCEPTQRRLRTRELQ